jgi:hypothetical protein
MATWHVSDELDARLREYLGDADLSEYVEQVIGGRLDFEHNPRYRAEVRSQIDASLADIAAGRVVDAEQAMRLIAAEKRIRLDR